MNRGTVSVKGIKPMKVCKRYLIFLIRSLLIVLVLVACNCNKDIQNQEVLRFIARSHGVIDEESDLDHVVRKTIVETPMNFKALTLARRKAVNLATKPKVTASSSTLMCQMF